MTINRNGLAALTAVLISAPSSGVLYASSLQFGVVGSPIDMSANVSEAILPGANGNVFQKSMPLFGTEPGPKQSTQLLHLSSVGVNASRRSTNISDAFASSLAESDGNGGVGISQTIFGSPNPGGDENVVRQLVAQSLWTQTFVYNGIPTVDISLHLHIPALQVQLIGSPPNRDNPSFTETAEARANVDTVITHSDGTFSKGGSFEFGLREFETQLPGTGSLINFVDVEVFGEAQLASGSFVCNFIAECTIDSVSTGVNLGKLHTGDTLAYIYTLTAEGTTHGFERGYDAFVGDPFGVDVVNGNLGVTVSLADTEAPEASTCWLMLFGIAGLFACTGRRRRLRPRAVCLP
jgi:hypothetical protein